MKLKEFREIGLCEYEMKVINALRQQNDLRGKEIVKFSRIPQSKLYDTLGKLIDKNIIEKRIIHSNKKLTLKQQKEFAKVIKNALELGIAIRFAGYKKTKPIFHLNGNLKKYVESYIGKRINKMNKLKTILCGE